MPGNSPVVGGRFCFSVQAAVRGLAGSKVMTLDLLARMRDSLQLNGLSVKTQDAYLRAVRLLCVHSGCAPDQITEEHLRRCNSPSGCTTPSTCRRPKPRHPNNRRPVAPSAAH